MMPLPPSLVPSLTIELCRQTISHMLSAKFIVFLCIAPSLYGCGRNLLEFKDSAENNDKRRTARIAGASSSSDRRTVMVLDDGFDTSHPVFAGKIAGTYTITCPDDEESDGTDVASVDWSSIKIEDFKASILADLAAPSKPCTITSTINFQRWPELDQISGDRTAWNQAILNKNVSTLPFDQLWRVSSALAGGAQNADFHGTATAGAIAYKNQNVSLVLVQIELGDASTVKNEITCIPQQFLDLYSQVFQDPEVIDAYIQQDVDPVESELTRIAREMNVSIVNKSLGSLPRAAIEQLYIEKGCAPVNMRAYYQTTHLLTKKRNEWLANKTSEPLEILTIQSAGNEAARIDTPEDGFQCSDPANDVVIVGSYDATLQPSTFTNFGSCVDVYSFGDQMVVAAPNGFVNILAGTSFSAPIVVRHLTTAFSSSLNTDELRLQLLAGADAKRYLPVTSWPNELAYTNQSLPVGNYALFSSPRVNRADRLLRLDRKARKIARYFQGL